MWATISQFHFKLNLQNKSSVRGLLSQEKGDTRYHFRYKTQCRWRQRTKTPKTHISRVYHGQNYAGFFNKYEMLKCNRTPKNINRNVREFIYPRICLLAELTWLWALLLVCGFAANESWKKSCGKMKTQKWKWEPRKKAVGSILPF